MVNKIWDFLVEEKKGGKGDLHSPYRTSPLLNILIDSNLESSEASF
jgi:hypothetical protein